MLLYYIVMLVMLLYLEYNNFNFFYKELKYTLNVFQNVYFNNKSKIINTLHLDIIHKKVKKFGGIEL